MKLFKHPNHRNRHYMEWLRTQKCVATKRPAQVAHHIRLGTNGGQGLKPSDYFCVPLLHSHHTSGKWAIHIVGEETFLKHFNLCKEKIFIYYLSLYLKVVYRITSDLTKGSYEELIQTLISEIELRKPKEHAEEPEKPEVPSVTETEFYQKAMEAKKIRDKELRKQAKEYQKDLPPIQTLKASDTEFYKKAQQAKKEWDKKKRQELKEKNTDQVQKSPPQSQTEFYKKAREQQKAYQRKLREQNKAKKAALKKSKKETFDEAFDGTLENDPAPDL